MRDFKFTIPLDREYVIRSETVETDDGPKERQWLVLRGWASDASVDKLNGKMSENCIIGMVNAVNEGNPSPVFRNVEAAKNPKRAPVGIDVDHSGHWTDQIGRATVARALYDVPEHLQRQGVTPPVMYVEFEVDLRKSHGRDLQVALDDNEQLGLSIFGKVKRAHKEVERGTGRTIEHFEEVDLKRIAITSRPVNNITWIQEIRRSMSEEDMPNLEPEQEAEVSTDEVEVVEPTDTPETAAPAVAEEEPVAVSEPVAESTPVDTMVAETVEVVEGTETVAVEEVAAESAPAPVEELTPGKDEEVTLSPDAVADLMSMGAIVQPTEPVEAPVAVESVAAPEVVVEPVAEAPSAETAPDTVERSEEEEPAVEYVVRAVYAEFEDEVRRSIGLLTEALEKANAAMLSMQETIDSQAEVIRSTSEQLVLVMQQGTGRRGSVARSFGEEVREAEYVDPAIEKARRERVMRELVAQGKGHMATAMMLEDAGFLKLNTRKIDDPLLPGAKPGVMPAPLAKDVTPEPPAQAEGEK